MHRTTLSGAWIVVLALVAGLLAALGTTAPASAEQSVSAAHRVAAASIATGNEHTCVITTSNDVRCWGRNTYGQLGHGNTEHWADQAGETPAAKGNVALGGKAVALAAGDNHTCAILTTGGVRCWGRNIQGQLGYGDGTQDWGDQPGETPAAKGNVPLGGKAAAISAGNGYTCAVLVTGDVRCWGDNQSGQLGYGDGTDDWGDQPGETPAAKGNVPLGGKATAIAAGYDFTCALLTSGAVRCWGANFSGQLGHGDGTDMWGDDPGETPAAKGDVPLGGKAAAISTGLYDETICVLLASGDLRCWGNNSEGQLGYGDGTDVWGDDPGETAAARGNVPLGGKASGVSVGEFHVCAVLTSGGARCWGNNDDGQLGLGHDDNVGDNEPASSGAVNLGGAAAVVSAGADHSCAVLTSGGLRCWGDNGYGQLGLGNGDNWGDDVGETPAALGDVALGAKVQVKADPKLKAKVKPKKDKRAPYKFKVKGKLDGPFVKDAATCGGTVKVKVKAKGRLENGKKKTKKVLKKKTRILDTCKIKKKKLKIKPKKLRKKGFDLDRKKIKLKVIMKYLGTDNLERAKKKRKAKIKLN